MSRVKKEELQKMAETKYGKYIITRAKTDLHLPSYRRDVALSGLCPKGNEALPTDYQEGR